MTSTVPCSAGRPSGTPARASRGAYARPPRSASCGSPPGSGPTRSDRTVRVHEHEVAGLLGAQPAPHRRGGQVGHVAGDDGDGAAQDDDVARAPVARGQLGPAQLEQRVGIVLAQRDGGGEDELAVGVVGVDAARPSSCIRSAVAPGTENGHSR